LVNLRPAEPPPLEGAGSEILDEHVGGFEQLLQKLLTRGLAKIQRDRLFLSRQNGPVQPDAFVYATPRPHGVTFARRFNLDHFRSMIGEQVTAKRPGNQLPCLDQANTLQRSATRHVAEGSSGAPFIAGERVLSAREHWRTWPR